MSDEGYLNLAIAIIEQAYKDLVKAYKHGNPWEQLELENWFELGADWLNQFDVDGAWLVEQAKKEAKYVG